MHRTIKQFDRGDHVCIVDTTSGVRVVRYEWKPGAEPPAKKKLPTPKGPGLLRKANNYRKARRQHAKAGKPLASDEVVAARFAICQACPLFAAKGEGQGECTHPSCGCSLKAVGLEGRNKLRWATQRCPIGKWESLALAIFRTGVTLPHQPADRFGDGLGN